MGKAILYSAAGCFAGTLFSIVLSQYKELFIVLLLPMWGFVIGAAIANVISKK